MKDKIKKAIRFVNMAAMAVFMCTLIGTMVAGIIALIAMSLYQAVMGESPKDRISGWVLFVLLTASLLWAPLSDWAKEP